jgi:putative endonuclease
MQKSDRNKAQAAKCHTIGAHRLKVGRIGEDLAARHLAAQGWHLRIRNWRVGRYCEVDIIANDNQGCLVFVEVKTRLLNFASVEAGIVTAGFDKLDHRKQRKLIKAAAIYLAQMGGEDEACRFDAVVVYLMPKNFSKSNRPFDRTNCSEASIDAKIQHIQSIF